MISAVNMGRKEAGSAVMKKIIREVSGRMFLYGFAG